MLIALDKLQLYSPRNLQHATEIISTITSQKIKSISILFTPGLVNESNDFRNLSLPPTITELDIKNYTPLNSFDLSFLTNFNHVQNLKIITALWPRFSMRSIERIFSTIEDVRIIVEIATNTEHMDLFMPERLAMMANINRADISLHSADIHHQVSITNEAIAVMLIPAHLGNMIEIIERLVSRMETINLSLNLSLYFLDIYTAKWSKSKQSCINTSRHLLQRSRGTSWLKIFKQRMFLQH